MAKLELVLTKKNGEVLKSLVRQSNREVWVDVLEDAQERLDDMARIVGNYDMREAGTQSLFIPTVYNDEDEAKLLDEANEFIEKIFPRD